MSDVLAAWRGAFGDEYIERNPMTSEASAEAAAVFARILDTSGVRKDIQSIVEIGANVGINLKGLRRVLGKDAVLAALEPNAKACSRLREDTELGPERVIEADVYRIPVWDGVYDLVFTSSVLIHLPPDRLGEALQHYRRSAGWLGGTSCARNIFPTCQWNCHTRVTPVCCGSGT